MLRRLIRKLRGEIVIPPGLENPENLLTTEGRKTQRKNHRGKPNLSIGFWGMKLRGRLDSDNLDNVVVDVEITSWPSATQNPRGRVIEILGYEDDFGVDVGDHHSQVSLAASLPG